MKKTSVIIATLCIMVGLLSGCFSTKLSDSFNKGTVEKTSKQVVGYLNAKDYASAWGMIRENLQDDLSQDALKEAAEKTFADTGKFLEYKSISIIGQKTKSTKEDAAVAIIVAKYEKRKVIFTISFGKDMKIIGLYMK